MRVVRELADHGDVVPSRGEVLRERLHPRLGGADLGREVLRERARSAAALRRRPPAQRRSGSAGVSGRSSAVRTRLPAVAQLRAASCRAGRRRRPVAARSTAAARSSRPASPMRAAQLGVAREALEPVGDRVDVAGRDEEAGVGRRGRRRATPPTSVATTGSPAASASITRDRRALVRGRERDDVERRVERARRPRGSRRSGTRSATPRRAARRSSARRERAVADEREVGVDAARAEQREGVRAGRRPA